MNNGNNLAMFGENSRFSVIFQEFGFTPAHAQNTKPTGPHGNLISFEYIADAKPEAMIILDREKPSAVAVAVQKCCSTTHWFMEPQRTKLSTWYLWTISMVHQRRWLQGYSHHD